MQYHFRFTSQSILLLCCFCFLASCNTDPTELGDNSILAINSGVPSDQEIRGLLGNNYRQGTHDNLAPSDHFIRKGTIKSRSGFDENDKVNFLRLDITPANGEFSIKETIEIQLDEPVSFPKQITNAQLVFLGNQVVIIDDDKKSSVNFYVNDGVRENNFPDIPGIDSFSIGVSRSKSSS